MKILAFLFAAFVVIGASQAQAQWQLQGGSGGGSGGGASGLTGAVQAGPGTGVLQSTITPTGVTPGMYTLGSDCETINAAGQVTSIVPGACGGGGGGTAPGTLITIGSNIMTLGPNLVTW